MNIYNIKLVLSYPYSMLNFIIGIVSFSIKLVKFKTVQLVRILATGLYELIYPGTEEGALETGVDGTCGRIQYKYKYTRDWHHCIGTHPS